jgi:hypothetical protein
VQAKILAFDQTMQHDENERDAQLAGAGKPSGMSPPKPAANRPPPPKRKKSNR